MKYKLIVTTRSYLLAGSGEGSAMVDTDIVFHKNGFPYIPARRVKGLLKESAEEVLEILGKTEKEIDISMDTLFGKPGAATNTGKLVFANLYVEEWEEIKRELQANASSWEAADIRGYYTTEIHQTTINEKGIAENGTLRNYRVLNPEKTFVAEIVINDNLSPKEEDILEKAALNLRYAGTRRNRGFGNIRCTILPVANEEDVTAKLTVTGNTLCVSIHTLSSIVLALQLGDQNTIYSEKHISGSRLRGILAQQYISTKKLDRKNAHLDENFYALFLSGAITFNTLYFENSIPLPLYIHRFKGDEKEPLINVFEKKKDEKRITRTLGGTGYSAEGIIEKKEPITTFFFHNSREDRSAGRSTKDQVEGGIFYYEAIDEGQTFSGCLQGPQKLLQELSSVIGAIFRSQVGKSRSAQYGEVKGTLSNVEDNDTSSFAESGINTYVLSLESPLVLLNEYGEPEPGEKTLLYCIRKKLGLQDSSEKTTPSIKIEKAAAGFSFTEQYNASWQAKSGKIPVYKEGSSFLLILPVNKELLDIMQKEGLGEWTELGFGKIRLEAQEKAFNTYEIKKNNSEGVKHVRINEKGPKILQDIRDKAVKKKLRLIQETDGINRARAFRKSLNNHLVGRLERMIVEKNTRNDIITFINSLKDKPAWDALKNARLLEELLAFNVGGNEDEEKLEQAKAYWISFFRTLRKVNKQKKLPSNGRTI
jgi:CRISPR-associated protein Csx10